MDSKVTSKKSALKLLMVDDDADLGAFMRLRLSMEAPHFSIAYVESGQECLEYLKTNHADCILSDYQMPEMNGMELLFALREAGIDIPVIFVTGQGNEEVAREAFKNGAYDYFTKDFGFAHFARIINSVEQAVAQRTAETERRRADEALRASQKYLQTIIETEPECIKLLSQDGKLLMMNRAGLAMIEADSLEQVKGKRLFDLIVPEHREAFRALGEKVFSGGTGTLEFDMVGFKGRRSRLETRAVPLRNEKDEIIALLGVTRDITERKQVTEALEESRSAYQALAENLPGIVYRIYLREKGRMRFLNRAAERITGYTDEELHGGEVCKIETLILPEDLHPVVEEVKSAIIENRQFMVEYRLRHKDGGIRHMLEQGAPIYGPDKEPLYIDGVIFDVTGRKQADIALQESQSLLQSIINGTSDAIYAKDLQGRYLLFNKGASRYTGKTPEDVLGKDDSLVFPADDARAIMDGDGRVMKSGIILTYEEFLTTASGEKVNFLSTKGPLFDKNGNVTGLFGIARDITERKRGEDALRASQKYLQTIIDTEPECVKLLSSDGRLLMMNRAGLAMIEADSLEQVKGASISDLIVTEHREAFDELGEKVFQGGSGTLEFGMRLKPEGSSF